MTKLGRWLAATALVLGVVVPLGTPPLAAQEEPVALVIRIQGTVSIVHGDGSEEPAAIGARVLAGEQLVPQSGARAILVTATGAQQIVTERTTAAAPPRGAAGSDLFARALATLAQAAATDASAGGRQGMIRPIPGSTALVSPRNQLNVASLRPTFRWTATPGQRYELMLRRVEGGRPTVFQVGTDTTWTLPDDAPPLEHGTTYAWTIFVGGRQGGRPVAQQEFRVISLEESVELEDYLEEISVFGLDPAGDGLFLTAVAYRDLGLFYEARNALDGIEQGGSPLSADLYMLKGEILSELGHEEAARAAFDRAGSRMR
jgi:hypothetical protein